MKEAKGVFLCSFERFDYCKKTKEGLILVVNFNLKIFTRVILNQTRRLLKKCTLVVVGNSFMFSSLARMEVILKMVVDEVL